MSTWQHSFATILRVWLTECNLGCIAQAGLAAVRGAVRGALAEQPGFGRALLTQLTHSHPTPAPPGDDKGGAAACAFPPPHCRTRRAWVAAAAVLHVCEGVG